MFEFLSFGQSDDEVRERLSAWVREVEDRIAAFRHQSSERKEDILDEVAALLQRDVQFRPGDKVKCIESLRGGYLSPAFDERAIVLEVFPRPIVSRSGPFSSMALEWETGIILVLAKDGSPREFAVDLRRFTVVDPIAFPRRSFFAKIWRSLQRPKRNQSQSNPGYDALR